MSVFFTALVTGDFWLSLSLELTNVGLLSVFDGTDIDPVSLYSVFFNIKLFSVSHTNPRTFLLSCEPGYGPRSREEYPSFRLMARLPGIRGTFADKILELT